MGAYCLVLEGQAHISQKPDAKGAKQHAAPAAGATVAGGAATADTTITTAKGTCAALSVAQHDAVEIVGPATMAFSSGSGAHILVVEMAWDSRSDGRRDM